MKAQLIAAQPIVVMPGQLVAGMLKERPSLFVGDGLHIVL